MTPHKIFRDMAGSLDGECRIADAASGGVLGLVPESAFQYVVMTSTGTETRYLPPAQTMPTGAEVLLIGDTVGTSITVHPSGDDEFGGTTTDILYEANGGLCYVFIAQGAGGTKLWRVGNYEGVTIS